MYSVDQKIMSRNYTIAGGGVPLASFPCAASMAFNFAALSFAASVADKLALPVQSSSVDGTSHLLFLLCWNDRKHSKDNLGLLHTFSEVEFDNFKKNEFTRHIYLYYFCQGANAMVVCLLYLHLFPKGSLFCFNQTLHYQWQKLVTDTVECTLYSTLGPTESLRYWDICLCLAAVNISI